MFEFCAANDLLRYEVTVGIKFRFQIRNQYVYAKENSGWSCYNSILKCIKA